MICLPFILNQNYVEYVKIKGHHKNVLQSITVCPIFPLQNILSCYASSSSCKFCISYRSMFFSKVDMKRTSVLQNRSVFLFTYIFILHSRESDVSLCFGREVRTRLGLAISEVFGSPVFHIKVGRPVKCLAHGHNKRTCRLVFRNLP